MKFSRRHVTAMLAATVASPAAAFEIGAERDARAFLAAVIGRVPEKRKARAGQVLERLEPLLAERPFDPGLLMLKVAALGAAARASSFTESVAERYGSRSGDTIKVLRSVAPDAPWTLLFSGIWQVEVSRRGGQIASAFLSSSFDDGLREMETALRMAEGDPAMPFAYAVTILAYDAHRFADRARPALEAALAAAAKVPEDAASVAIRRPSEVLLEYLAAGDLARAERLCLELMQCPRLFSLPQP